MNSTPRPWHLVFETSYPEGTFCRGIQAADDRWIVRFDDDYSTDQAADAALIVAAVEAWDERKAAA